MNNSSEESNLEKLDFNRVNYQEVYRRFDWEKAMIYTPSGFVFSIDRDSYFRMKLETISDFMYLEKIVQQCASFTYVSEDLRMMDWIELANIMKFETYVDSEASDILYRSIIKAYPEKIRQRHRASFEDKKIKLLRLLNKNI